MKNSAFYVEWNGNYPTNRGNVLKKHQSEFQFALLHSFRKKQKEPVFYTRGYVIFDFWAWTDMPY